MKAYTQKDSTNSYNVIYQDVEEMRNKLQLRQRYQAHDTCNKVCRDAMGTGQLLGKLSKDGDNEGEGSREENGGVRDRVAGGEM